MGARMRNAARGTLGFEALVATVVATLVLAAFVAMCQYQATAADLADARRMTRLAAESAVARLQVIGVPPDRIHAAPVTLNVGGVRVRVECRRGEGSADGLALVQATASRFAAGRTITATLEGYAPLSETRP